MRRSATPPATTSGSSRRRTLDHVPVRCAAMLAIREAGDGDEPLVLVHGAGTSSAIWRRAMGLPAPGRQVVAPDVPGYGGSPPAGRGFALEEVTERLADGLDEAGVAAPYDLVGHS